MTEFNSIRELVRHQDRDRYWSALLAPSGARDALLALYAFNIELARVAELVREPHLGEIRLQWWRDALGGALAGEKAGHPVVQAIAAAQATFELPEAVLQDQIDARSFDVMREPMPDMAALRRYLEATAGAVFALGARICGAAPETATRAAAHAAMAYGLTGLMRALPFHASQGALFLPGDILRQHGVNANAVLGGTESPQLDAALAALREIAAAELAAAREVISRGRDQTSIAAVAPLPAPARAVFLPLALVEPHLAKLAAPGHRPLHTVVELNPLARIWLIWRAHRRGRV